MAVYGAAVYGESALGGSVFLENVDVVSSRIIGIRTSTDVIVNSGYYDLNNYSIEPVAGSEPIIIRRVIQTKESTTKVILLVTDNLTRGNRYNVGVSGLLARGGFTVNDTGELIVRKTKTDLLFDSIPSHFDKRPESVLSSLLIAMGAQDELIGGSRKDSIVYGDFLLPGPPAPPILVTQDGDNIITQDGIPIGVNEAA